MEISFPVPMLMWQLRISFAKDIYESIIKWLKKELESYSLLDIANNIVGEDKALSMINVYSVLTNLSFVGK